jgi:diguanylate cyclase (GGDEF)-like protein/PAS domain S-box-containing protein
MHSAREQPSNAIPNEESAVRRIAESIPEVVWVLTAGGHQPVYVSPSCRILYGYGPEALQEQPDRWLEAVHPEDRERVRSALERADDSGVQVDYRVLRSNGESRSLRHRSCPVAGPTGTAEYVIDLVEDTSQRVLEAQEQRDSEKRYYAIFSMSPDYIFTTDLEGRILDANPAFIDRVGLPLLELKGTALTDISAEAAVDPLIEGMGGLKNGEQARGLELEVRASDGSVLCMEVTAIPLSESGEVLRILHHARDVSDRKAAEDALESKTRQQDQLLEAARQLAKTLDTKDVLVRIATSAREVLKARACTLYLLDEDGTTLTPVVSTELPYEDAVLSARLAVDGSFTGQAVKARRGLIFNDAWSDPKGYQIPGTPEEEDERVLVTPLVSDGTVLGAMCISRMEEDFGDDDLSLAEGLAAFAATALKNAQTHQNLQREAEERRRAQEALRRAAERIERLDAVAHRLEACSTEEQVFQFTVDGAEAIALCDFCVVSIPELDELVPQTSTPRIPPEALEELIVDPELARRSHASGEPEVCGAREGLRVPGLSAGELRSEAAVPIGKMAMLQAFSVGVNAFTQEDVRLLELLAAHTTQALKRIRLQHELREQAVHDPLTGVYNRYYLREALHAESSRAERHGRPIAFLMMDVDRLKRVNDQFGHLAGDRLLQAVASLIQQEVRDSDIVVRYGGDEFLVILPETSGEVRAVTERIVRRVPDLGSMAGLAEERITLSIGSAHWKPRGKTSLEQAINEADNRMYDDKRSRRDQQ